MFLSTSQKRVHQKVSGTGKSTNVIPINRLKKAKISIKKIGGFVGIPGIGDPSDNSAYWEKESSYYDGLGFNMMDFLNTPKSLDTGTKPTPLPWYQNILNMYGAYKTTQQQLALQKQANDIVQQQISRGATLQQAQANAQALMRSSQPQIGLNLGLSTNTMLLIGGGAAVLLIILMMNKRKG